MKIAQEVSLRWQRVLWLLPLLPLIFITDLTALLWLGSTALILMLVRNARQPTFSFVYRSAYVSIAIGVTAGAALHFLVDPWLIPLAEHLTNSRMDLTQFADVHGDAGAYIELLIVALLFGGVIEEITFRGFFVGWGSAVFGDWSRLWLVVLISVVFGLGHWYQGPAGAIVTGVGSIVFGVVYVACRCKLLPAIACHMTVNFLGVTEIYVHGV